MARPLTAIFEVANIGGIEEDDGFRAQRAVFRRTERKRVDADLPCHLRWRGTRMRERIGEARAVHMQLQVIRLCDGGNRGDFAQRIDSAELGRLREADGGRLGMMHDTFLEVLERRLDGAWYQLAVFAFDRYELRAMGEELRRAAFVDRDMCFGVAEDRAVLRAKRGKRE